MNDFINDWISCGTIFSTEKENLILGWGKRTWQKEPDTSRPCFYFPDFFLKGSSPWFIQEHTLEINASELISYLSQIADKPPKNHVWDNPHETLFSDVFHDLQTKIASAELAKGVPFVIETSQTCMDNRQLVASLKAILNYTLHNPTQLYGFWDEKEGMLGATPEILFCHNNNGHLQTMACAGTKNILEDQNHFLSDSKELYEHELVVKGIAESLTPYGKVSIGKLQLLKLSKLMHLVTPLSAHLNEKISFQKIVEALHPTPALGAFPKKEGFAWLENLQQRIDRVRYGAPVGCLFPEKNLSHCYVAIRNVQWNQNGMQIAAGGGVVADSHYEKEWAEIQLKLKAIKEMLAL